MVRAADRARLERVIYLGGLGEQGSSLSEHLESRAEVARILQSGPVPRCATLSLAALNQKPVAHSVIVDIFCDIEYGVPSQLNSIRKAIMGFVFGLTFSQFL